MSLPLRMDDWNKVKQHVTTHYKSVVGIFILSIVTMLLSMVFTLITEFYTRLFLFIPFGILLGVLYSFFFLVHYSSKEVLKSLSSIDTKPTFEFDDIQ
jgi:sensor c-di-GMP phosphodiesterase-like protein